MRSYVLTTVIMISLLSSSCDHHERREAKYSDGKPKEEFQVVEKDGNFIKDGEYKTWYIGGQQEISGTYSMGKKTGNWKKWYDNGQMELDLNFKNDTLDGPDVEWYKNGRKSMEGKRVKNKWTGELTTWYEEGQMRAKSNFNENGKPEGEHITWNVVGVVTSKESYKNGVLDGVVRYCDQNGKLICLREFKDGDDINLPATYSNGKGDKLELLRGGKYKFIYANPTFFYPNSTGDFTLSKSSTLQFSAERHGWLLKRFSKDSIIRKGNAFTKDEIFVRSK